MTEVLYYAIPFFVLLPIVEGLSFRHIEDDHLVGFERRDTRTSLTMGLGNDEVASRTTGSTASLTRTACSGQAMLHTERIAKLTWPLEAVLNTPSHHRVHLDRNYGGILIIWDRLFGTYEPEADRVRCERAGHVWHDPGWTPVEEATA